MRFLALLYTIPYYIIPFCIILYYIILYYAILFSTLYSYTHAHMHSSKFKGASLRVCKEFLLNAPMKGEVKYRKWSSNLRVLFTFPVYQLACFGVHPLLYFLYQPLVIGQFWHLRVSEYSLLRDRCVSADIKPGSGLLQPVCSNWKITAPSQVLLESHFALILNLPAYVNV